MGGTLSGHAAGEPFDKLVYSKLKKMYGDKAFRQFEYLNTLYLNNPTYTGEGRSKLFKTNVVEFLLERGKKQTAEWSPNNLFEEKQNDTADNIVVFNNGKKEYFDLVDVKTRNDSKDAQPPNIISALKLAKACKIMLENNEFGNYSINYVEINWKKENKELVCTGCCYKELFKTDPAKLYINWAAALQIQFHVSDLTQTYKKDEEQWCSEYLDHFVRSAEHRIDEMNRKMVKPFEKYKIFKEQSCF